MPDVVVTLPKSFGLKAWIEEGDAAGDPPFSAPARMNAYYWKVPTWPARLEPPYEDVRVYVVYDGRLIGYAPLHNVIELDGEIFLVRLSADYDPENAAVAVTIDEEIPGFGGFRYRWWDRDQERSFPEWKELAA